jgi:hypothetical protein
MYENAVKFLSFLSCLADNVNALDFSHVQFIKDATDSLLINVREGTRDAQAWHCNRQGSEVNLGIHFDSLKLNSVVFNNAIVYWKQKYLNFF